ncbi:MAG TPA: hypothetical protein VG756_31975 [Pseudonocardiaceae bacterium]|jgi:hypothetical protein|nr:hypothetical protein [Pseudonocardiaceae bacterium]
MTDLLSGILTGSSTGNPSSLSSTASSNPLVSSTQDSTTWHSGLNIVDDAASLHQGISSGSWIESGLSAVGTGLDAVNLLTNPVSALVSCGLNFLIEHIKPLQDALNWLAGDANQVNAYGGTWHNVSGSIGQAGSTAMSSLTKDTQNWTGQAATNYRGYAQQQIDNLTASATAANTIGSATQLIGGLVLTVRNTIRDLVTQAIGQIIQMGLAALAFPPSIPALAGKVAAQVVAWMQKIANTVRQLIGSMTKLTPLMNQLQQLWNTIKQSLSSGSKAAQTVAGDVEQAVTTTAPAAATAPKAVTPKPRAPRKQPDPRDNINAAWKQYDKDQTALYKKLDSKYTLDYERGPNYREEVEQILGPPPADGNTYVAHHTYPVNYSAKFKELGIDTTDPTLGTWVEEGSHQTFSADYDQAWRNFFGSNSTPPTKAGAEALAKQLATDNNYTCPMP